MQMSVENPDSAVVLLDNSFLKAVSRDGRFAIAPLLPSFSKSNYIELDGETEPNVIPFPTQIHESARDLELSPKGDFLAYSSNETGNQEIYVVTFPAITRKVMVSTGGGTGPKWSQDGRHFYYFKEKTLMKAPMTLNPNLVVGKAEPLFEVPYSIQSGPQSWDVSSDGERFLMLQNPQAGDQTEEDEAKKEIPSIFLTENWHLEFEEDN
jgi:Tol biopolymer transport system component